MSEPLFSDSEVRSNRLKYAELEKKRKNDSASWEDIRAEEDALDRSVQIETVRRVKNRRMEYLDALLVVVGSKGAFYVDFLGAFNQSDYSEYRNEYVKKNDTPESRLALHTILKALTEIPKSWARSAFVRFLRGTGKQKKAKYHGAGSFGPQYGWTEREVTSICEIIAGDTNPYAKILMSYADVQDEIKEADPDFEVIRYDTSFKVTRVERDVEFINELCVILESRGLAKNPEPKERKKTKPHVAKIFKPGDVIRKNTIRDLPLPAHVKIPIERLTPGEPSKKTPDFLERVVMALCDGHYHYAAVKPGSGVAYKARGFMEYDDKPHLNQAIYVGPWKGRVEKGDGLKINFLYRYKT